MPPVNASLLSSLPSGVPATGRVPCQLIEYSATGEGAIAWDFLYYPERIETQKNARYSVSPLDGHLPSTEYGAPELRTVTMNNLLLRGWYDGRSMSPIAEGLERLTIAPASLQSGLGEDLEVEALAAEFRNASPPVLSFLLGGRSVIAPCVVVSTSRIETAWFESGDIAEATISLTLQEVSKDDLESQV